MRIDRTEVFILDEKEMKEVLISYFRKKTKIKELQPSEIKIKFQNYGCTESEDIRDFSAEIQVLSQTKEIGEKEFVFIFWENEDQKEGTEKVRKIKAENINEACEKFMKRFPKNCVVIDYEVESDGKMYEIFEIETIKEYLK